PLRRALEGNAVERREGLDGLGVRNDLLLGDLGFLGHPREPRSVHARELHACVRQARSELVDLATADAGDLLQRAEALGLLAGLLHLGHEEANASRERRDAGEDRAATAQRTEHRVERALERTKAPGGFAAEAQERLPDELD